MQIMIEESEGRVARLTSAALAASQLQADLVSPGDIGVYDPDVLLFVDDGAHADICNDLLGSVDTLEVVFVDGPRGGSAELRPIGNGSATLLVSDEESHHTRELLIRWLHSPTGELSGNDSAQMSVPTVGPQK